MKGTSPSIPIYLTSYVATRIFVGVSSSIYTISSTWRVTWRLGSLLEFHHLSILFPLPDKLRGDQDPCWCSIIYLLNMLRRDPGLCWCSIIYLYHSLYLTSDVAIRVLVGVPSSIYTILSILTSYMAIRVFVGVPSSDLCWCSIIYLPDKLRGGPVPCWYSIIYPHHFLYVTSFLAVFVGVPSSIYTTQWSSWYLP